MHTLYARAKVRLITLRIIRVMIMLKKNTTILKEIKKKRLDLPTLRRILASERP